MKWLCSWREGECNHKECCPSEDMFTEFKLIEARAIIALSIDIPMWFNDSVAWYEAMGVIMSERAPA